MVGEMLDCPLLYISSALTNNIHLGRFLLHGDVLQPRDISIFHH
jgi:hypothetical protein